MSPKNNIKAQYDVYEEENGWQSVYHHLRNQSTLLSSEIPSIVANDTKNKAKNRYRDVIPYDRNRVVLEGCPTGDYINASLMSFGEEKNYDYILTQGPLENTVPEFWFMVYTFKCPAVIMINRFIEKGICKCANYFPLDETSHNMIFKDVGITVKTEQVKKFKNFVHRTIKICVHEDNDVQKSHTVEHLHFLKWPDFGVPESPRVFLSFLWYCRNLDLLSEFSNPSVIHCSAGIGRSGTLVLIDVARRLIEETKSIDKVDVHELFIQMRLCRAGTIQSAEQLKFCYESIIHCAQKILITKESELSSLFPPEPYNASVDDFILFNREPPSPISTSSSSSSNSEGDVLVDLDFGSDLEEQHRQRNKHNIESFDTTPSTDSPVLVRMSAVPSLSQVSQPDETGRSWHDCSSLGDGAFWTQQMHARNNMNTADPVNKFTNGDAEEADLRMRQNAYYEERKQIRAERIQRTKRHIEQIKQRMIDSQMYRRRIIPECIRSTLENVLVRSGYIRDATHARHVFLMLSIASVVIIGILYKYFTKVK